MTVETEVVFPRAMRDIYPAAAQQLYIETYKRTWAESKIGTSNQLSRESVAARDAWDAVKREFVEDSLTHKWRRVGDQATANVTHAEKGSFMSIIKRLFKR
jgi:cation transport regulator ChaB